ncbi:hypothetical protein SS1G_04158 [Sclerotinia sclerotiorum 1980 UF-70]|uniref:Uncharacterized protein n=1 Tax=Sclerotinia sclerotiorum (strain ATCC 18683 / 1980 / Ss-1) TaxID=665079 RepID=A7EFR7_SCLS1|nr:hypothetical protein SS1G_04158 [Sclerotinia sclerotiorum 1980 UF-70]EDO01683.1 hypothetical protein SS1G_04158 [Sclerotinia sclerotiorum 1980 UF-70]
MRGIYFLLILSPPSFCKCTCFTNSTIIPLSSHSSSSSDKSDSKHDSRAPAATCTMCNRAFCLAQRLPICKEAEEKDACLVGQRTLQHGRNMSEQFPVEPFIYFIERFRAAMVALLQGIVPLDSLLESVDKIIWHALRENKQDYTSIILQAVFQTMGVSQEQKNRFIRHAGWANHMWNVNGTYHNSREAVKFSPTKPIYQSDSWHQRQEDSLENWTRPFAVQHNNIEQRQLAYLSNTVPQPHNSYLETGKYPKHLHCAVTPEVAAISTTRANTTQSISQ